MVLLPTGTGGETSSADEFLDAALTWFGDADPRLGTAWEKGERLARLMAHHRALLILDGLEPLQHPPGTQEGRLRELALQALLRELADAFARAQKKTASKLRRLVATVALLAIGGATFGFWQKGEAERQKLPRMDSNHDKVIQSLFKGVIGHDRI